jgi:hypothetical protein
MTNVEETQSEPNNNNNSFEKECPPTMVNFDKEMQQFVENFQKCIIEEIKFDDKELNKKVTNSIQIVKEQHNNFRKFIVESLKLNKNLLKLSEIISNFVDYYKGEQYSEEKFLARITDILEQLKENRRLIKELINMISNNEEVATENIGIKMKLTETNNSICTEHIEKDKDNKSKMENMPSQKESYRQHIIYGIVLAIGGAAAGVGLAAAAAAIEFSVLIGVGSPATGFFYSGMMRKQELNLEKQLKREQSGLTKLGYYCNNLKSVADGVGEIESLWIRKIVRIDEHIREITRWLDDKRNINKLNQVVNKIGGNWKVIRKECDIYCKTIEGVLNIIS